MKILHISWGLGENNGAANIARLIIGEQKAAGNAVEFVSKPTLGQLRMADQVWCHCGWYWVFWFVALYKRLFRSQPSTSDRQPYLLRMTECCYDPIRVKYHGWKKSLAGPFERWSLRQCDALVATCEAEAKWNRDYVGRKCPKAEISDIKRFFRLNAENRRRGEVTAGGSSRLNVLYLGRPHPLKGTRYLEQAVKELNCQSSPSSVTYALRLVSNHHGDELERDWEWCDVLCLPTLSDNFALVVAEALERGKRVITTDGAPAWSDLRPDQGLYLRGYRDGTDATRVRLLKEAMQSLR